MEKAKQTALVRAIGRWDLVALAVNAIIGAGIFALPAELFRRIGTYSLLAFVACSLVVLLIILCFAEVSSRFAGTGGPYLYALEAFGPAVGFEVGWMNWIARVTAFAANCNLLVDYLGFFWPAIASPGWRAAAICMVVFALTILNLIGVRDAAVVSDLFTVAKLAPLALFIVAGLFFIHPAAYSFASRPALANFSASVLLLVYAFSGFEMATIVGGEARHPQRDMPLALLTAITVVAVFYILIQVVAIGTLPELATSARPLADAGRRFLGSMGGAIISAGAVVSILGNLNVILLVGARLPFALAERHALPRFIAATHPRFRTPHISILMTSAAVLLLSLSGTFLYAATISVIARLFTYAATCAALPVLRRRMDAPGAVFKTPAGMIVSLASLLLIGWLLSNTTGRQARDSAIAAAVGLLIYVSSRARADRTSQRRAVRRS